METGKGRVGGAETQFRDCCYRLAKSMEASIREMALKGEISRWMNSYTEKNKLDQQLIEWERV